MATVKESQKSRTTRPRMDAPDMIKLREKSKTTGDNYTCAICGAAFTSTAQFRIHAAQAHEARNKEPYLDRKL